MKMKDYLLACALAFIGAMLAEERVYGWGAYFFTISIIWTLDRICREIKGMRQHD